MEVLRLILRYAHLIGFALLLGGAVAQYLTGRLRMNPAMLWGAAVQLLTGLALAAPIRDGGEPAPAKLVVKLVLAVVIVIMVWVPRNRPVSRGHFLAAVGLTLVTAAVATFW